MRVVLSLLLLALVAAGCTGAGTDDVSADVEADAGAAEAAVRVVSVEEAVALLAAEPAPTVIDVRTPQEFAAGHIEGAELVDYNDPGFRDAIAGYDRDGAYVIYCRSGNRSAGAREVMAELGFGDVADVDGGIQSWLAQDLPVVTG